MLLPFTLMTGLFIVFHGDRILGSISLYYHSRMRNVFVGALCAIALFLFFYRGYDNWKKINWDMWLTNVGGFFALGIAFFPTALEKPGSWLSSVHFICAAAFFLLFAFYSIFVFTKKGDDPTRHKLIRNKIYVICGLVMIAALLAIFLYVTFFLTGSPANSLIFWGETVALIAFGISWLTKGGSIYADPVEE